MGISASFVKLNQVQRTKHTRKHQKTLVSQLRQGSKIVLLLLTATLVLTGCNEKNKEEPPRINRTITAQPAPQGWINSKDGAFRIQIPKSYLDAYDAVSGNKLPDAQIILSLPSNMALNGYIPVMVIDHAKATSDPDAVENSLKKDQIYHNYHDFTVLNPTSVEGLNIMELSWKYTYNEVKMTAFLTMVSGNNHAYSIKQDVPDYALESYQPIIDTVLKTWTWNTAQPK